MSNVYRVLLPILVNGEHKQGDVFEHQFDSATDELSNLDSGLLEIVPRKYKNISTSVVYGVPPGEVFEAAIPMGAEEALFAGGHIERVEEKKATAKKQKEVES